LPYSVPGLNYNRLKPNIFSFFICFVNKNLYFSENFGIMSKKSKGSSAKKSNVKKPAKPVKKNAVKKPASKTARPASGKAAKPSAKKKVVVKAPAKKVVAKKAPKPLVKSAKPSKKIAAKKVPLKKSAKPAVKTKIAAKPIKKVLKPIKPAKAILEKKANNHSLKPAPKPIDKKELKLEKAQKQVELVPKKVQGDGKPLPAEVLAISNTIPKHEVKAISASKIASISSSITNPIKKVDSYSIKPEKEPNGKYELEFVVRSSPEMLYEFLSTPSGLSEWFCDDVNIRNGIFTFIWDGQLQQARLLKTIDDQLVRFQWVDKVDGSYFEFKIQRDDLTNDISLIVTDFAEMASERESSKLLWQSQVEKLLHIIGSIF